MKKALTIIFLLIITFLTSNAQGNHRTITGTVIDKNTEEPLIGVSILVKGTTTGTITDLDGNFSLNISSEHKTLVVAYIGYKQQEIDITSQSRYQVKMEEDVQLLEEVVVVAYGIQRKQSLTGSLMGISASSAKEKEGKKKSTTWKRSGMKDNSIRLQVGENDFLPLEAAQMAVQIDGFRVRVLMDCFFYNDKGNGLEGTFKLKLPTDATPYFFAFGETEYINENDDDKNTSKKIPYQKYESDNFNLTYQGIKDQEGRQWNRVKEARIVSKQKAAKAYEQTVSANIDPALMEWGGADIFSCRVYPLSNNTLHRIVIGYDLNMTEALDFREYIMSLPKTETELKMDIVIHNSPLLQASITPQVTPVKSENGKDFYSFTNPKENEYIVRYDEVEPVMLVQETGYDEEIDIPYFAANYRVELPETLQENLPADAVFLLDVSISSNPDKFNVWLKLIEEILDKNKDIIKRFAVLTFNIDQQWYGRHFQKNNYHNMSRFLEYANTLALEGATDLSSALKEASNPSWIKEGKNTPKHIFLMSDADYNWGETNMHTFKNLLHPGDQIHTYKTGLSGTNSSMLNYLSKTSGGFAFTVTGEEEATLTARSFRYKPWNIENITVDGVEDFLISGQPTQLYNGQKLIFSGRDIPSGNIHIDVNNGSERRTITYTAKEIIKSALVSRIYGQIASSYLESYGFHSEDAAINYSTYYKVPGQYTSFLMLESERDYDRWGIDDSDAESFVEDNTVNSIVKAIEESGSALALGYGKSDFQRWLKHLSDDSDARLDMTDEFDKYIEGLPEEIFSIKLKERRFGVQLAEQQTDEELEMLADDDLRFDNLFKLAKKRSSSYGKPNALKLLSSVVERNAADVKAIRDVAMTAIDWDMGDHAYYMMRRIIDWREGEALAYMTAAEALANAGYIDMALVYYYICLQSDWDSDYGDIETIVALKANKYLNQLSDSAVYTITAQTKEFMTYMKDEVVKDILANDNLEEIDEADIVVIVSWNIDNTDIDLHILEPTGEKCYYGNSNTKIGGQLTKDVTSGYGPEMYVLEKAPQGEYSILLDYYADSGTQTATKAKAYIEIYRNWGRKNEKVTKKVIPLRSGNWNDYDEDEDKRNTVMKFKIK